ncbi:Cytosolic sulfotransferase 3 (SULT1 ST3) [Durusdinium trenchii]|uniref:Cytosolic sulfotransferase 3 (SULT1 ST3) n=1 Tax=Durusdinium trenchii TaxID=1381693 RepID=A0ABP0K3J2_9DINO
MTGFNQNYAALRGPKARFLDREAAAPPPRSVRPSASAIRMMARERVGPRIATGVHQMLESLEPRRLAFVRGTMRFANDEQQRPTRPTKPEKRNVNRQREEHSTCEPFCISSYGRSHWDPRCSGGFESPRSHHRAEPSPGYVGCKGIRDLKVKRVADEALQWLSKELWRCHGFIEERKALREGSCAKRLLLRSCQQCKEACQELPEEMPIRFPEDEPRVADVWITSYPKAGSTWVRHLITNLHFAVEGQRRPASFKEVDDFIPFIEDGQGWTSRTMFRDRQGLRFWKSHSPFHCDTFPCKGHVVARQGPSQCMCPNCAAKFRRVVYIYRNGYNTMASYFRFRLGLGHLRDRRNFGTFVNDRRMYPGTSWADHVRSWQHAEQRGVKIFWLRYEALEEHTEAELQRLAQFLGLKAEEEHLSLAVNASSASTMQEMEHTEGGLNFFKLRYNRSSLKFVSSGQGNMATKRLWQDVSEEVLRTWRQHNGPTMRCLGYPDAPV